MAGIFDGHVHLIGEDADEYLAALLRAMDRNGVERAVVFGLEGHPECPDSLALAAHRRYPDRFVPFTCEINPDAPDLGDTLDRRLAEGPWSGVGEIYISDRRSATSWDDGVPEEDNAFMRYRLRSGEWVSTPRCPVPRDGALTPRFGEIFAVCAARQVPALVHCYDLEILDTLLQRHADTTFILGHADFGVQTHLLAPLLERHPNLRCEAGAWLHWIALDGDEPHMQEWATLWLPLLDKFAARCSFGSDHYEWWHLEPDANADCAYQAAREIARKLSREAAQGWLHGALERALKLR